MALVKTSKFSIDVGKSPDKPDAAHNITSPRGPRSTKRGGSRAEKAFERIAAATEQLASGLTEATTAARDLERAMEQIASGAEEAAGASQQQLSAIQGIVESLRVSRIEAETCSRGTENARLLLADVIVRIAGSVRAIERNASRQNASVERISELERRARDIGEITRAVSRISDQTNLLALNAAIEAARAGDLGRGFAVVADEVRALAETADGNAREVTELAARVESEMRDVIASIRAVAEKSVAEALDARRVAEALEGRKEDMREIGADATVMRDATIESERAASEARKGAEQVSVAAEQQAAGAAEAQTAVKQQAIALDQGRTAARSLAGLAEKQRSGHADASTIEQISAAADELSATIQEMTGAATQIMAAVDQIHQGAGQQAAATHETSVALERIEESAKLARHNAGRASERVAKTDVALEQCRAAIERLARGVELVARETRASGEALARLEAFGRNIEKNVEAIALVAVQTSMLAVNGSVEAARAGASGKGFAVVSNDIRGLARESASNVERAKNTVRAILDQIATLKRDLEQIIAISEVEGDNNAEVVVHLQRLGEDIAKLAASNRAIVDRADDIMTGSAEASGGARQIATAAEEASAASRQAAAAANEQTRGAEDLAAAIEEIASLADAQRSE